jgi:hypothetical protein
MFEEERGRSFRELQQLIFLSSTGLYWNQSLLMKQIDVLRWIKAWFCIISKVPFSGECISISATVFLV